MIAKSFEIQKTSFQSELPAFLKVGKKVFCLLKEPGDTELIHQIDYIRVPDKTNDFLIYRSLNDSNIRPEIIVHTKSTLASHHENDASEIVAKKTGFWSYKDILSPEALASVQLPSPEVAIKEHIQEILAYDKVTEGDSLRFFNYLASTSVDMPKEFWPVMVLWLCDEMNHHAGFKTAYHKLFGVTPVMEAALAVEESDFGQFDSIMKEPFKLLVALTYDEASTINGYKHDLAVYKKIGQPFTNFLRKVNADESWHFSKFANLAAKYFPERIAEVPKILEEVKSLDGRPYKRTFLFDHDPSVEAQFTKAAQDKACDIVLKVLTKKMDWWRSQQNGCRLNSY